MTMSDEQLTQERDELRMEIAIQTTKDILLRFEEMSEGSRSVYEVLGFLLQDLINDGLCPACINAAVSNAFIQTASDTEKHKDDEESVYH